jgi:hypothetical protein
MDQNASQQSLTSSKRADLFERRSAHTCASLSWNVSRSSEISAECLSPRCIRRRCVRPAVPTALCRACPPSTSIQDNFTSSGNRGYGVHLPRLVEVVWCNGQPCIIIQMQSPPPIAAGAHRCRRRAHPPTAHSSAPPCEAAALPSRRSSMPQHACVRAAGQMLERRSSPCRTRSATASAHLCSFAARRLASRAGQRARPAAPAEPHRSKSDYRSTDKHRTDIPTRRQHPVSRRSHPPAVVACGSQQRRCVKCRINFGTHWEHSLLVHSSRLLRSIQHSIYNMQHATCNSASCLHAAKERARSPNSGPHSTAGSFVHCMLHVVRCMLHVYSRKPQGYSGVP